MSTITNRQYDEEIDLIVSGGMVAAGDQMRDDRPALTARLEELAGDTETLGNSLARLQAEMRLVRARLLPNDERKRLAQLVLDFREGKMPDLDADVPVTACPDWCESDHCENGQERYHEGAVTTVDGVHFQTGEPDGTAGVYVTFEEGRYLINVHASANYLDYNGAMNLAIGMTRAAILYQDLCGDS